MNKLKVLFLRDNKLTSLDSLASSEMENLERLNIRQNQLEKFKQVEVILSFKKAKDINLLGNPCMEEGGSESNKEILMLLPQLKRLNKEDIKQEDVEEAQRELRDRLQAE